MIDSFHKLNLRKTFIQYLAVLGIVISVSTICFFIKDTIGYRSVSFILLFLTSILAIFFSTGPVIVASALSAGIWDFFFIPPYYTFQIGGSEDTLLLIMFLIVAIVNGILTSRVKKQEQNARRREKTTLVLYQLTKELLTATGIKDIIGVTQRYFDKYFDLDPIIVFGDEKGIKNVYSMIKSEKVLSEKDKQIAEWVLKNSKKAGKYTEEYDFSGFSFFPMSSSQKCFGVICVLLDDALEYEEEQFMEALVTLISGKVEREFLSAKANDAFILEESDKLYKTLFNSISHELRIPVATIMGATDTLLSEKYPESTRKKLYSEMSQASIRLNRLIENLLSMSRLEFGHLSPRPDWCDIQDLINKVSEALKTELSRFKFVQDIPENMPLVFFDSGFMEQILYNLILNSTQYSQDGTMITTSFSLVNDDKLVVKVKDCGKGFSQSELPLLFNKFYRGEGAISGGTGLGLSIVKGLVEALGGYVFAENSKDIGAIITVEVPVKISSINEYL